MPSVEKKLPSPRTKTSRWWLLALVPIALWLLFRLFEPVATWSTGWQPLPDVPASAPTAEAVAPDWAPIAPRASALLGESRGRLDAPALSAAIMIDGQRVWASAIGFADIVAQQRAELDTRFRLGSTSKTINALAMGRLVDAGQLDIDRPVREYLPDLPGSYDAVTTRQAISHTAGVPEYSMCFCFPAWEHLNRRHFSSVRDALHVFEDRPLLFAPGSGFRYSSYGTNVVGAVVAAAAKRPYLDLVADSVFQPLGMTDSRFDVSGATDPRRAIFYEVTEGQYKPAEPVDNSIRYPSGGMLSTPSDMLAVGRVLLGGDFLSEAMRRQMLTPQPLSDGSENPQGYALGVRVFDDKKLFDDSVTTAFYSHHGTAVGSTSYFAVYPEYELVVSMMMNKGQQDVQALAVEAQKLVELFLAERARRNPPA